MTAIYSSEYNKRHNAFKQGLGLIRRRNAIFFDNILTGNSIYDLKDINSYFEVGPSMGKVTLRFRNNSGLPAHIRADISALFQSVWPEAVSEETNNNTI